MYLLIAFLFSTSFAPEKKKKDRKIGERKKERRRERKKERERKKKRKKSDLKYGTYLSTHGRGAILNFTKTLRSSYYDKKCASFFVQTGAIYDQSGISHLSFIRCNLF